MSKISYFFFTVEYQNTDFLMKNHDVVASPGYSKYDMQYKNTVVHALG